MKPWDPKQLNNRLLIGSTLVEGSTFSEKEAALALAGLTVSGHTVGEHRELLNYEAATSWLVKAFKGSPFLSLDVICDYHSRLFSGLGDNGGAFKSNQNFTYRTDGTRIDFEKPALVRTRLQKWIDLFNAIEDREHVFERGAKLYYEFEIIHPFNDGNGRIGRVLMAYWFWRQGGLSFEFFAKDKVPHLRALQEANEGDFGSLARFFKGRAK